MVKIGDMEGAVGSITTEMMALKRKVAGLGSSISELVRSQNVPARVIQIKLLPTMVRMNRRI